MIHFLFSMKTQKAPARRVQGLWNSFLLAVCQQVLDLLQGVDDAGNGHIVVQCHHKVGSVLGNIHVHIPVAGQQLGHTVGQVGAHNVGQGAVCHSLVELLQTAGEQGEGGVGDDVGSTALLQVAGDLDRKSVV